MALIHRMKILLSLLQESGGQLTDCRMQQWLFLYCREYVKRDEYYEFIPLNGKPFSLQAEADKQSMIHKKLLENSADWILKTTDKRFAADLDFFEKIAIQDAKNTHLTQTDEQLAEHVAARYPYFTQAPITNEPIDPVFYTIGYEGISPEAYINLLLEHQIRMLVDVRRNAYSQKYGFSKAELASILPRMNIEYLHMPELGIASEKRQNLTSDKDYEALFNDYEQTLDHQRSALDQLQQLLADKKRIAITCFEADPCHCHRSRVAKALKARESFNDKIEHLKSCKHP